MVKALALFLAFLALPAWAAEKRILTRDIAAGEVFEHTGPVLLQGNVGEGATITIKQGGLEIRGRVGKAVTLDVEGLSDGRGGYSRQSLTVVGDGALLVVTGQMVDVDGAHVPLEGPVDVIITGQVGNGFTLVCGTAAMLRDVGRGADITVQQALSFRAMQGQARVKAGQNINGNHFGGGVMEAGQSIKLKEIGKGSDVAAGEALEAERIRAGVKAHAGDRLVAKRAHKSAVLTAGTEVVVGERY